MLEFLSNNWLWILLIGGMLVMHLGHAGGHGAGHGAGQGGHGGCGGGHQHSGHQHSDHRHSDAGQGNRSDQPATPSTTTTEGKTGRRRPCTAGARFGDQPAHLADRELPLGGP